MRAGINRLLAILLSCAMLLGMLPAFAEEVPASLEPPIVEAETFTAEEEEAAAEIEEAGAEPEEADGESGEAGAEPEESDGESGEAGAEPEESDGESGETAESAESAEEESEAVSAQPMSNEVLHLENWIGFFEDCIDIGYDGTGYLQERSVYLGRYSSDYVDSIVWMVSDPSVVRVEPNVDRDGFAYLLVKGAKPGEATITPTDQDGDCLGDSIKVIVYWEPKCYSVSFSKNPVPLGETVTVNVCTSAEGVSKLTYGFTDPRKYLGETTQKTVVGDKAYWSFQVTPERAGWIGLDLELKFTSPCGSEYSQFGWGDFNVSDGNTKPSSIYVQRQDLSETPLSVGEICQMEFYLQPENSYTTVSWKSSNTNVATVDAVGLVTAVGGGEATITATSANGKSGSTKIQVVDAYQPTAVKLDKSGSINLSMGETLTLTPSLVPETAQATFSWASSNTKVATVADGVVTPVSEGTAAITVTATRGGVRKTAFVNVTVVDPYKPTALALDKTGTVNVNLGEALALNPILSPETAQADYTWKSSSAKVATVVDGVVTPVGEGTATITVTATRGKIKKTATVKVKVVDPYKPTGVKLDKTGTVSLNLGETLTLTPILSPETAQATYTWKSSSAKIATVVDGVVTPVGEGTATITVTATRGKIKKTATVKVKVVDPYKPTGVKLDKTGTVSLNLGETLTLTPNLSPETAQATYTWKSSSAKIATVVDGVVTPVGEGTATITVTATRGKIKKTATVKVNVVDPNKPTGVKLDRTGTVNLNLDESLTLTPSLAPETAQATYSWKSSSTKIATVADGVVTPVGEGTATITVTATRGKIKKTATVKVKVVDPYKPASLKLKETGTVWLDLGDSRELTPILTPDTAKATYSWKSSSTKIATVDENGVVRSVSKGTATITVTATRGKIKKTASVKVKVVEPYVVDALSFIHMDSPGDLKLLVGELSYISVGVKPASASKTANLSFSLSNDNVYLSRKSTGEIRVQGVKPGTTTITVKDVNTDVKATMKVVVRNRQA